MWKCPNCKMTNDTYKCKNCGLDESKAYTHHRTITWLTQDRTGFSFGSPASACSAREFTRKNDCRISRKNSRRAGKKTICTRSPGTCGSGRRPISVKNLGR